jgi:hypothetical protein
MLPHPATQKGRALRHRGADRDHGDSIDRYHMNTWTVCQNASTEWAAVYLLQASGDASFLLDSQDGGRQAKPQEGQTANKQGNADTGSEWASGDAAPSEHLLSSIFLSTSTYSKHQVMQVTGIYQAILPRSERSHRQSVDRKSTILSSIKLLLWDYHHYCSE